MPSRPPKTDMQGKGVAAGLGTVPVDGRHLTLAQVETVARDNAPVRVTNAGRARALAAHQTMLQAATKRPIYGQSTGVGSNKDTAVTSEAATDHGLRLIRSHAAAAGPEVSLELARAMMVVRLNQLAAGGSGVHPRLLDALAQALNKNLTPPLKRYGAIGTGDLTAFATTALCILGEQPWIGGTMLPYPFEGSDALAFMSSNAATLGEAVLARQDIERRLHTGLAVAALSHIAMGGSPEAYDVRVHRARPHRGQTAVAEELGQLLGVDASRPVRRIQDTYGLRTLPQVQGAALEATGELGHLLQVDINAACENPLVSHAAGDVYHNGNFLSVSVGLALDKLRAALCGTASLSVARIGGLMASDNTGLRPFLADGPVASSGVLIIEYVAHSALAELRHLALPDSMGGAVLSHGTEEHACFATQAAGHTTDSVAVYETILACELLAAMRALRQAGTMPGGAHLRAVYDGAAGVLSPSSDDGSLGTEIAALTTYLHQLGGQ